MVALALAGCAIATYLTLYQWRVTVGVWDPLFGSISSEAVLTSAFSRALPLPDATLGALAYAVEAVLAALGGPERWRTAPWLVVLFGVVMAGLALVGLILVLTQAFVVQAVCTLCLLSAAISWVNGALGGDEVAATVRALKQAMAGGMPLGQALRGPIDRPRPAATGG
ncbi:MAG: vitamin K epoxide reductase [Chloroflexota bacterium]|nr:vitamin K epoxide reductase [Chloroflexota bacterium]